MRSECAAAIFTGEDAAQPHPEETAEAVVSKERRSLRPREDQTGYCQPGTPRMSGRWWAMPLWQSMQVFSPVNRKR